MKKILEPYEKDNLILRLLLPDDINHTLQWRNNESHRPWFNTTNMISEKEHHNWYQKYLKIDNDFIFIITDQKGLLYGQLSIYRINWQARTAEFGRFLANPKYENIGIMKKACKIAIKLAKETLNLKELTLEVKPNNQKAIHIYNSCGFISTESNSTMTLIMKIKL
ncbi:MAG: GNAT family N-acetyltransferase [Gammaproteobacteria bacterium]|nr:GNAT family N-acetyltransferase [Gammaproteobacteria bacterium]